MKLLQGTVIAIILGLSQSATSQTPTNSCTIVVVRDGIRSERPCSSLRRSVLRVTPTTDIVASGQQGGPFTPSSFDYVLSASRGSINYSISGVPNWLTPSSTSGSVSTGTTETFTVNANATGLSPATYPSIITFTNSDSGQVAQTRTATLTVTPVSPPVMGNCGLTLGGTAIFCDPFDAINPGIPSRTGALDPNVWGVSRTTSNVNFPQGLYNAWAATEGLLTCNGIAAVAPPNDIGICNGQLREVTNDEGNVTALTMYPKQPFDFAGRTGTVSFDLSNDSHGTHAAWPEFWITDLPVPAPFVFGDGWRSNPQNGLAIRFAAAVGSGSGGSCPNLNNLAFPRWTVDLASVIRNYVMEGSIYPGESSSNPTPLTVTILDCVIAPPDGSGIMNHIEVQVNQNEIGVYATDAGISVSTTTPLRKIASITNANLTLTRGLVWFEDAHYNAEKGDPTRPLQINHTFVWDNLAFDGPFTFRDFSYDALDVNQPIDGGAVNLGQGSLPGQTASWSVLNMPANPQAATVRVLFNFNHETPPTTLNVIVNGHAHSTPWPYPDQLGNTWRTLAVTIPITDLVPGTNVVQLGSDQSMVTSNVNIVLANVPGGVPVLPGSNNAYPH